LIARRLAAVLILTALSLSADAQVRLATVPAEYRPTDGTGLAEEVVISNYYFEANDDGTRARVVVEFACANATHRHLHTPPEPSQLHLYPEGLVYDRESRTVNYLRVGQSAVCASMSRPAGLFVLKPGLRNSGNCVVAATTRRITHNDGWKTRTTEALDLHLEVK
jgi:hypothetical protein